MVEHQFVEVNRMECAASGHLLQWRGILHELTPEETEEAFQQHLIERNKEKTA